MMSLMNWRVSVSMGQRLGLEVTMIDIGDIDILVGIGVVRGAEADQESIDEGDRVGKLERRNPHSIKFVYESHYPM